MNKVVVDNGTHLEGRTNKSRQGDMVLAQEGTKGCSHDDIIRD